MFNKVKPCFVFEYNSSTSKWQNNYNQSADTENYRNGYDLKIMIFTEIKH